MSPRTLRILAIAVVVLFAAVWLVNRQRNAGPVANELLFPGLEDHLDGLAAVTLTDADGEVRIERRDNEWVVPAKGGYRADTAKLRALVVGLAEAHKIEQKTSNPELYERIGVQDPREAGKAGKASEQGTEDAAGVLVASEGLGEADFAVILGDSAQGDYRYVRAADDATSWLIDRNPEVPDAATGWLVPDLADIAAARVQSVTIRHAGGETIRIHKESKDDDNFAVEDIPEGRELSYPSVANSIAAALDNLSLDDVRPAGESGETPAASGQAGAPADEAGGENGADDDSEAEAPEAVTTVYRTFDGLEVTVESTGTDDATWIRLHAAALPMAEDTAVDDAGPPAEPAAASTEPSSAATGDGAGAPAAEGESADGATADGPATVENSGDGAEGDDAAAPDQADAAAGSADAEAAEEAPDPAAEAAEINARVSGWEYRIPQYKASQLRRGWEDLLRAPADEKD